ncbi:hypothetical protein [Chryseobacterium turcicum]|uniref:Lipocalin-like domain-containing protein n=1 Tax=Chryseobacterium turcicum TaxID=2898076 RepID=A0A9Q3V3U4_9FLAO|nr:hypothetical protein [Chryseobacterium turcicum]MCD1116751.1 hypothetical protein [Chryseobacterium turcicum]
MKIIISSLFMIVTILFFPKQEIKKDISGTWKLNLYTMDSDTIYYENHEKYTVNYFEKTLGHLKSLDEKKKIAEKLYNQFKTAELHINKNTITSYKFDGNQSKIELKYKMVGENIILDEKSNQKYKYRVDYNQEKDILTVDLGGSEMNVITRYSRIKN